MMTWILLRFAVLRLPTQMYVLRTSVVGTAPTKRQFDSGLKSSTNDSTTLAEEEDIDMIGMQYITEEEAVAGCRGPNPIANTSSY